MANEFNTNKTPVQAEVLEDKQLSNESKKVTAPKESEISEFLKRISQELKSANAVNYPPTAIRVAEEIDAYINRVNYVDTSKK